MRTTKQLITWSVVGVAGLSAGCEVTPPGIPRDAQFVAGGYWIDWEASQRGTAFVLDSRKKLIRTQSLEEGEAVDLSISNASDPLLEAFDRGVSVYFRPEPFPGSSE